MTTINTRLFPLKEVQQSTDDFNSFSLSNFDRFLLRHSFPIRCNKQHRMSQLSLVLTKELSIKN